MKKKIGAFLVNNLRYFIWYLFHLHLIFIRILFVAEKESYFDSCPTFNISQLISEMHSSNYTISTTEY